MSSAVGAEFKVTPSWKVGATYFVTRREMADTGTDILDIDLRDNNTIIDPTSTPAMLADGRYYVNEYKFTNPRLFASFRLEAFTQKANGLNLKSSWTNDDWRVEGAAVASGQPTSCTKASSTFATMPRPSPPPRRWAVVYPARSPGLGRWSAVGERCVSDMAAPAGTGLNGRTPSTSAAV